MIFKKREAPKTKDELTRTVAELLPDADDDTRSLVVALAGLLASVAFADGDYHPREQATVLRELRRIQMLPVGAAKTIAGLLDERIKAVTAGGDQTWARTIKEGLEREGRLEVLDALLEIAAADGELSTAETNYLRRLAPKLGLTQADYVALQSRHRDKLAVLE
ncbi:MAG: TerB family tellurite resistance protein [Myxococcota bacterium]